MSFAREVKKELLSVDNAPCCKTAEMAGLLQGLAEVSLSQSGLKIIVRSHLPNVLRHVIPVLKNKYDTDVNIGYSKYKNINKQRIYFLEITKNADIIINDNHLMPFDSVVIGDDVIENECCESAFVRGAFIAKGSINDPKKSNYHLEIVCRKAEIATLIQSILNKNDIESKILMKKNQYVIYIKKSEEISKFLAFSGAASGVFYFEDSRIYRDLNNTVNRIMNCDIANGNKSQKSCAEQLAAIKYLEERGLDKKLSSRLQDAIKLRKEYPDSSLSELSEYSSNIFGKELSKSGISHCMTEIMKYYKYIVLHK